MREIDITPCMDLIILSCNNYIDNNLDETYKDYIMDIATESYNVKNIDNLDYVYRYNESKLCLDNYIYNLSKNIFDYYLEVENSIVANNLFNMVLSLQEVFKKTIKYLLPYMEEGCEYYTYIDKCTIDDIYLTKVIYILHITEIKNSRITKLKDTTTIKESSINFMYDFKSQYILFNNILKSNDVDEFKAFIETLHFILNHEKYNTKTVKAEHILLEYNINIEKYVLIADELIKIINTIPMYVLKNFNGWLYKTMKGRIHVNNS